MTERPICRREMLRTSGTIAVGVTIAPQLTATGATPSSPEGPRQSNEGVVYHYKEPYDYSGVMRSFPPPRDKRITVANYRLNQANRRWALTHMREIFPSQDISRGSGPVAVLPRAPMSLDELSIKYDDGVAIPLKQHLQQNGTDAFLVLHKGASVTEQYFHGMRPETPHNVFSLGKSLSVGDDILSVTDANRIAQESFPGPRHGLRHMVAYRSQYAIPVGDHGDFYAAGYNGQYCYVSPKSGTVIVKFSTYEDDTGSDFFKYDRRDVAMCQQIAAYLGKEKGSW